MERRTFLRGAIAGGLVVMSAPTGVWARSAAASTGSVRVYLIIVDGLRPGEVALMPQLSALAASGSFYPEGRAEMVAETTTNHMTLLTGMRATRHGMPANAVPTLPVRPSDEPRYTKADSILTLMRRQAPELRSATIGAKTYVSDLAKHDRTGDGRTDATYTNDPLLPVTLDSAPDEEIGTEAVRVSRELDPDFLFVNLGDVDRVGHLDETGGLTAGRAPAFRTATLLRADAQLRRLVTELQTSGRWAQTVFMVTADHSMDWSFRDRGLNLAPLFEADPLLRAEVRAAINGGASLYALRSPDDPLAHQRLRRMREIASSVQGVRDALHIRPNPLDGDTEHWVGRVHPQWGLGGDFAGDFVVTVEPGYRLGHRASTPAIFANPIPGNHGHPTTLPIPVVISGGWSGVRQRGAVDPGRDVAPTEEHPSQARNVDLVPTAAWLLGLNPPPGGFDGQVREEAFAARPEPRAAARNVASMPVVTRVAGRDTVGTVLELSRLAFPDGAATVVVVSGIAVEHALPAVPLASARGGPVLLAEQDGLLPAVAAEVRRLGATRAFVLGGTDVLRPRVEDDLRFAGVEDVVRLGADDAFGTARRVATELGVDKANRQVVLVGSATPVDVILAGPVAAAGHPRTAVEPTPLASFTAGGGTASRPLLLTGPGELSAETAAALQELSVDRVIVVGDTSAVSLDVEEKLRADGLVVERIGGHRTDQTAALLAERGIREGAFTDDVYLIGAGRVAEGIAAGAALGRLGGTLVLCPRDRLAQTPATRDFLHDRADEFVRIRAVGDERSLSRRTVDEVIELVRARRTRPAE
jgi:ectonucleotide pyrophosphatase/phosphodiesterase family protein 5